jgi:hypothetical protein
MSGFLMWLLDNVNCGKLTPYIFGLAIGRWPHKVKEGKE